jgi:predicted  nucleic acid-binding Zn-ribbon protein
MAAKLKLKDGLQYPFGVLLPDFGMVVIDEHTPEQILKACEKIGKQYFEYETTTETNPGADATRANATRTDSGADATRTDSGADATRTDSGADATRANTRRQKSKQEG